MASQLQKPPKRAASRSPQTARISSVMASRPWRTRSSVPSAKQARYIGSTGRSVRASDISMPTARNDRSTRWGIVSTVGPVSNR